MRNAILGLAAAVSTLLVAKGILGGDDATNVQAIIAAGLTLAAALGIKSLKE